MEDLPKDPKTAAGCPLDRDTNHHMYDEAGKHEDSYETGRSYGLFIRRIG